jgi:hypothetical protein
MEGSIDEVTLGVSCGRRREGGEEPLSLSLSLSHERGAEGVAVVTATAQEEQGLGLFSDLDLQLHSNYMSLVGIIKPSVE